MKSYVAYGSNMHPEQMARRCAGAVLDGAALLPGHRFIVTREGYGSVVPDPAGTVHGVLWQLAEADERALDEVEAARRHGFPAAYLGELTRWLPPRGPETEPGSSRTVR